MTESVMPTYGRLDVTFSEGKGAWLTDTDGKRYLDALSGIAVCNLGHCHPAVTRAIQHQAETLVHTSNMYHIALQEKLADKLTALSGMDQVFFCNSGAEANEAAIKIARKYGHSKGIDKPVVIVMDGSFHGRTMATLTATGNAKVQVGFDPLVPGFVRVPYNDLDALRMAIGHWPEAVAVLLEPVQGEGGIKIPDSEYLAGVRAICTQRKLLMMLDEVQTGIARTGKWFAYQHNAELVPDVMTLAKGLGNGMPIGACLVAGNAVGILQAGNHGSTFGGNPLACSAALSVLNTIEEDGILGHVNVLGKQMLEGFQQRLLGKAGVKDVRAHGMMFGIELSMPCAELVKKALAEGLLINVTAESVIRLLPPLILNVEESQMIVDKVSKLVLEFLSSQQVESVA
ncbi:MAG: aspartate aminotransferase family protein [Pseudomonadota bacterium]|uniref:Acetylornithine aminotransferase n=2 Tax=Methylophaga TaxID=40222 RepID=F5T0F7_9GAMM|nr:MULTISPECIES: aspartate aminotransferase family protein [Methylophaga]EGL55278.1 ornithine/acetylornithine aminotransferase [Methylophaga aminisulfidivorans MP]MEC9413686.1 aspartate aminotransferase family protein [Pseudomonadota bacterium]GLP99147.1 acetylornithine aminotransferase 1 [Methylophaga thalassica]